MTKKERILDDLKKLSGIPPYDDFSNIVMGDGYFAKSLERKYHGTIDELIAKTGFADIQNRWNETRKNFK